METSKDNSNAKKSSLDVIERVVKLFSLIALPVVLAIIGFLVEAAVKDKSLDRDYVKIALEILQRPVNQESDSLLRAWAVDLLKESSPVKLPDSLRQALIQGSASIPVPTDDGIDRAGAREAERLGFERIRQRDIEGAIEAFNRAEQLWPTYHWVYEIGRLLTQNREILSDPNAGQWTEILKTLILKYHFGIPMEHKVAEAQRLLKNLKNYAGEISGTQDDSTTAAIRRFQRASGLVPDGILGPVTLRRMLQETEVQ